MKRLVQGLIVDFGMPCDLLDVIGSEPEWAITVRDHQRRVLRLQVRDAAPPAMRASIKAQLEALLDV